MADAEFKYNDLRDKYGQFQFPIAVVNVNGNDMASAKVGLPITDVIIENSVGYEAGMASFRLAKVWDNDLSRFKSATIEKYLPLGAGVDIALGYSRTARTVFKGYISKISYTHTPGDIPGVVVTCMDMKGLMMSGTYSKQITGVKAYSEAVKKIFEKYEANMKNTKTPALDAVIVDDTPDASVAGGGQDEETARTIEMQDESDYEFVVKAAKRYNYEFLVNAGTVAFRKARSYTDLLMDLDFKGFRSISVEENTTGQVEKVEVRAADASKGSLLTTTKSKEGSDTGTKELKKLISGTKKVYIDPSCDSKDELENRAEYLLEENSYKFVTMQATMVGLPEFAPGRFITLMGLKEDGSKVKFYIQKVIHQLNEKGYLTKIVCRAKSLEAEK